MDTAVNTPAQSTLFSNNVASLEVITFHVGATQYATPVSEVRYIEQDKRETTRIELNHKVGAEVTSYQGKTVPVYDFAGLMGCEAVYIKNLQLMDILNARQKDHVDWVDELESCLRTGSDFTLATDPKKCEFGQWYGDFKADDELLKDILSDFDKPHQRIHALAAELIALRDESGLDKALAVLEYERGRTLAKLVSLFTTARERLESITRPILLYIDTGHKMIALRLNAISDIMTYGRDAFTTQQDVDDNDQLKELSFVAGYLEGEENTPPCVLLDWSLFTRAPQHQQAS